MSLIRLSNVHKSHLMVHFPGAVIVVSHDRFFIDKVATKLLVFEGPGQVREINGNWTTWQAGRRT